MLTFSVKNLSYSINPPLFMALDWPNHLFVGKPNLSLEFKNGFYEIVLIVLVVLIHRIRGISASLLTFLSKNSV